MFFVCMFACLFVNFSKLAKLAKSINLVKFKKLMLLFTRLFVYLQYKYNNYCNNRCIFKSEGRCWQEHFVLLLCPLPRGKE